MKQSAWFIGKTDNTCHLSELIKDNMKDKVNLVDEIEEADVLCLVNSNAKMFAEITRAYADNEEAKQVLDHLSIGRKVIVVEEGIDYRKYKQTCPSKLYERWLSYEQTLKSYGVEFVKIEELLISSKESEFCPFESSNLNTEVDTSNSVIAERVVTESNLSQIPKKNSKTITIKSDAIVTPLAQDYIRQEHLILKRASDRS